MSARKLQAEIDRTLKRVKEGVEEFEALHDKLQSSTNQGQKEKMESDLKTMIKKLQRLRDQIRTWIQSNEIKDKNALLDNRRLIETQMEKFKAVEKEMKTKAFSKEGLAAAKLDPAERAKLDATNWLANHVDELAHQVEAAEAEVEQLSASTKKTRKGGHNKDERIASLETHNEARRYHINRLELVLRIVENGTLEPESIDDIKDEVDYFVEKNSEEDMTDYEGIYDQFNLDEEEEKFGLKDTEDGGSSHESASVVDEPVSKPKKREEEPKPEPPTPAKDKRSKKKSTKEKETKDKESKEPPKPVKDEIPESDKTVVPPANFTKPAAAGVSPPKPAATPNLPPIRYATAAAAAMGPNSSHPSGVAFGDEASEPAGHRGSIVSQTPTAASAEPPSPSQDVPLAPPGLASSASKDVDTVTDQLAQTHVEDNSVPARQMPPVLVGLAGNLDQVKQSSLLGDASREDLVRTLEGSALTMPDAVDSDKPAMYVPKSVYPTPAYYPQLPLPVFNSPELYGKMDVDTLFFIFYYQQGTYHQYLAARELKRQSWRFHTLYLTWFQRHTEPSEITDEYEVGTYVYFDWEGGWVQRRKTDFRFEYRYLEDSA